MKGDGWTNALDYRYIHIDITSARNLHRICDPYVLIMVDTKSYKSSVVRRTAEPVWNQSYEVSEGRMMIQLLPCHTHGLHIYVRVHACDPMCLFFPLPSSPSPPPLNTSKSTSTIAPTLWRMHSWDRSLYHYKPYVNPLQHIIIHSCRG